MTVKEENTACTHNAIQALLLDFLYNHVCYSCVVLQGAEQLLRAKLKYETRYDKGRGLQGDQQHAVQHRHTQCHVSQTLATKLAPAGTWSLLYLQLGGFLAVLSHLRH